MLVYELPLNEIVVDFYDRLKSVSRGYASMDYELAGYRPADLVKLDVRINGDVIDAMSMIVPREKAYYRGRDLVQKMRELIPRQLFEVVIQAAIGSRVVSRESVKALRKADLVEMPSARALIMGGPAFGSLTKDGNRPQRIMRKRR